MANYVSRIEKPNQKVELERNLRLPHNLHVWTSTIVVQCNPIANDSFSPECDLASFSC